ncbi:MAG: MerR family transcriptional regulator [Bacteroidetes bacterium]|nr:MAG: MerR family transcriptional regulator [Bacteroidota bacterium]
MDTFTIKDLETISGIKAHTIRIWEQRYSLIKPTRTGTNIRRYSSDELRHILNISLLNKNGFKISHISRMTETEMQEKILSLSDVNAQRDRLINELIANLSTLELDEFEKQIDSYIHSRGIEKTINQLIFPFLEKIGILWLTNNINPAQEHLVTNIIRSKLINGIECSHSHYKLNKTFLLFLPESEYHELGLLFVYYLLKSRGAKVHYLGSNIPLKDAAFVIRSLKPDVIYMHLTSTSSKFNLDKYLQHLKLHSGKIPVIISGYITQHYKKPPPVGFQLKKSLSQVMEYISSLST